MDQLEFALRLQAVLALVAFQKWKELAMSVASWIKTNHLSLLLGVVVALEVALVVVVVPLLQEEPVLLQEWVERLESHPVIEVLGSKSSCTEILALYQVFQ